MGGNGCVFSSSGWHLSGQVAPVVCKFQLHLLGGGSLGLSEHEVYTDSSIVCYNEWGKYVIKFVSCPINN